MFRFKPTMLEALGLGIAAAALAAGVQPASAEALLLVDAASGKVLQAENAGYPWYPASVTKLMTAYVTLHAIKQGRLTLDTLLAVSNNAVAQQPSKMGFKVGTRLTVDNALKMMLVKSANDMAVVLAEGVGASVESFAAEMTRTAHDLGMTQSNFVNPNGLPDDRQVTSARDLAILTRALIRDFPEYEFYFRIPAIKLGRKVLRNYNPLLDRYPGADGMKTGFICAAGFNLVATATRGDKRLIAVVLGAPSSNARAEQAAELLEKGFSTSPLSWLLPSLGTVDRLAPIDAAPPDLHEQVCGKHKPQPGSGTPEEETAAAGDPDRSTAFAGMTQAPAKPVLGPLVPSMPPVVVFVGPPKKANATVASADPASDANAAALAAPKSRNVPLPRPRPVP